MQRSEDLCSQAQLPLPTPIHTHTRTTEERTCHTFCLQIHVSGKRENLGKIQWGNMEKEISTTPCPSPLPTCRGPNPAQPHIKAPIHQTGKKKPKSKTELSTEKPCRHAPHPRPKSKKTAQDHDQTYQTILRLRAPAVCRPCLNNQKLKQPPSLCPSSARPSKAARD